MSVTLCDGCGNPVALDEDTPRTTDGVLCAWCADSPETTRSTHPETTSPVTLSASIRAEAAKATNAPSEQAIKDTVKVLRERLRSPYTDTESAKCRLCGYAAGHTAECQAESIVGLVRTLMERHRNAVDALAPVLAEGLLREVEALRHAYAASNAAMLAEADRANTALRENAALRQERDEMRKALENEEEGFGPIILQYIADIRALKEGFAEERKYILDALETADIIREDGDEGPDNWGCGGEGPYSLRDALRMLTGPSEEDVDKLKAAEAQLARAREALTELVTAGRAYRDAESEALERSVVKELVDFGTALNKANAFLNTEAK